jgi:hypothetical protein
LFGVPVPVVTTTLWLEPLAPFTTVRHEVPEGLRLPRNSRVTLTVATDYPMVEFVWSGARPVSQEAMTSTAEVTLKKAGVVTVSVTPMLRLRDGTVQAEAAKTVVLTATEVQASKIAVRITDPAPARRVGYKKQVFVSHAETSPGGYEGLIEWTGGGRPSTGLGAEFTTAYEDIGQHTLRAGTTSTMELDVYEVTSVRWASAEGQTIWYGYPITFKATTEPAGYEGYVPWQVDSMADMHTHAEPSAGTGATFTTTFMATGEADLFWAQIYAAQVAALSNPDQSPPT